MEDKANDTVRYLTAFIISGIFMIIGYFFAGIIIAGFLTDKIGLIQGIAYSAKDIVGNIIQVTTGTVIALPLTAVLLKAKHYSFNN